MKSSNFIGKLLAVIFAVFTVSAFSVPAAAFSNGIEDNAGLFTDSQIEELEKRQEEVAELTGWNIAVVTTDIGLGTDGSRAIDYAEDYYDRVFGSDSSSVVYLVDIDYRHVAFDGEVNNYIDYDRLNEMLDACESRYFDWDDMGTLTTFYNYIEKFYLKGTVEPDDRVAAQGEDFVPQNEEYSPDGGFSLETGALLGVVAAIIGVVIVLSRYKLHHVPAANGYLDHNSVDIYRKTDQYVRTYTTKTRIDSGSSGSGRSSGGRSRSSGGRSHSGGGRGGRR